jgi:mono/diheme cytochrome c family protein
MTLKTVGLLIVIALGVTVIGRISVVARANAQAQFNAAKTYQSKCASCHGKKAEKKFDKTKADDAHVQVILKGKKAAKPPHMPGYETKGITADQALALVTHMKSLQP